MPNTNISKAGNAALWAMREHGLYGRPDSPPEWNAALNGARAGTPILVKDPDNARDDFFLVPLIPANPAALRGVWVMLDTQTLALREASLLENWKALAFPDQDSGDAEKASQQAHTLPDGTVAKFRKEDFTPNTRNLVWKASAASILPYWPLKELIAPHPITGQPVSIYVTQDGKVYSALLPDEVQPPTQKQHPTKRAPRKKNIARTAKMKSLLALTVLLAITSLCLLASTLYFAVVDKPAATPVASRKAVKTSSDVSAHNISTVKAEELERTIKHLEEQNKTLTETVRRITHQRDELKKTVDALRDSINGGDPKLKRITAELARKTQECDLLKRDLAKQKRIAADATAKYNNIASKLNDANNSIKQRDAEIMKCKKALADIKSDHKQFYTIRDELLRLLREHSKRLQARSEQLSASIHHSENQKQRSSFQKELNSIKRAISLNNQKIKSYSQAKP